MAPVTESMHEGRVDRGEARFERAFAAHYAQVLGFALRRTGDRAAAEDIAADTFAVAWRRRRDLPDEPLPWLFGVARRVMANRRRSQQRRGNLQAKLISEAGQVESSRDPADVFGSRSDVHAALAAIPEMSREVLRLVAWEGLDTKDGATACGCSPAAFRVRLYRARRQFGKALAEQRDAPARHTPSPSETEPEEAR